MRCVREDFSFNNICLNMLEGTLQLYLLMRFKKYRYETPYKDDKVKCMNKTSNCENLVLGPMGIFWFSQRIGVNFSSKIQPISGFVLLWFL